MNGSVKILECKKKGDEMWVKITGDIDHHTAKTVRKRIDSELFISMPKEIWLDLSSVNFMDSSGLGLILGRYKTATELGIGFYVYEPTDAVRKILKLSGCEKIVNIVQKKVIK